MGAARKAHTRRHRRQQKMAAKGKFHVNHRSKSGRTGSIHSKKPKKLARADTAASEE